MPTKKKIYLDLVDIIAEKKEKLLRKRIARDKKSAQLEKINSEIEKLEKEIQDLKKLQ